MSGFISCKHKDLVGVEQVGLHRGPRHTMLASLQDTHHWLQLLPLWLVFTQYFYRSASLRSLFISREGWFYTCLLPFWFLPPAVHQHQCYHTLAWFLRPHWGLTQAVICPNNHLCIEWWIWTFLMFNDSCTSWFWRNTLGSQGEPCNFNICLSCGSCQRLLCSWN